MDIPEKLNPIPKFNRDILPKWIEDFGTMEPCDELPDGAIVMTARGPKDELFHIEARPTEFDADFGERYVRPMIEHLGGAIFEAEHPNIFMDLLRKQYRGEKLTDQESVIVARRDELSPHPPIPNAFLD